MAAMTSFFCRCSPKFELVQAICEILVLFKFQSDTPKIVECIVLTRKVDHSCNIKVIEVKEGSKVNSCKQLA